MTLIIGVLLVGSVAQQSAIVTDKTIVSNEVISVATTKTDGGLGGNWLNTTVNLTVANNPLGWKSHDCALTDVVVTNATGTVFTLGTDYIIQLDSGIIHFLNNTATWEGTLGSNTTLIDYHYCGDNYLNLSWGRTGVQTGIGLFGVAILLVSVGLFFSIARDSGLMGGKSGM